MFKMYHILIFINLMTYAISFIVPPSPCPKNFKYQFIDNIWSGKISIYNIKLGHKNQLKVLIKISTVLTNNFLGKLEILGSKRDVFNALFNDEPLEYKLTFPIQSPLPRMLKIEVNNKVICKSPVFPNFGVIETEIELEHTLEANFSDNLMSETLNHDDYEDDLENNYKDNNLEENNSFDNKKKKIKIYFNPRENQLTNSNFVQTPINRFKPIENERDRLSYENDNMCGRSFSTSQRKDQNPRGLFPWMVAIYKIEKANLIYHCSGVLISNLHILTAAHCFYKNNEQFLDSQNLLAILGKYELKHWRENGAIFMDVESINPHPLFRQTKTTFYADIAVLTLENEIIFTKYIRPICLWNTNLDDTNNKGVVALWTSEYKLEKIEMPVVSQEECLRSNRGFFDITTNMTFCAGNRDGSGPCTGNSGTGLFVQEHKKWYLKGIVTMVLTDSSGECNLNEYIVFQNISLESVLQWLYSFSNR